MLPSSPDIWRPIESPADFPLGVEDVLYHARLLADRDANPFYESVIGLAETLAQLRLGPCRPRKSDRQYIESIWPVIKSQTLADGAEGAVLRARAEALCDMVLAWPADAKDDDQEEGDDEHSEPVAELDASSASHHLGQLDAMIASMHHTREELGKLSKISKKREAKSPHMAQASRETAGAMVDELNNMLKAIDSWADDGEWPLMPDPDVAWGIGAELQLLRYLPDHANAIESYRHEFKALHRLPRFTASGGEINNFGDLLLSLRWTRMRLAEVLELYPDHRGLRSIENGLDQIARQISAWIIDGTPRSRHDPAIAKTLAADLDLLPWPQHAAVQAGVWTLARLWKNWPPASMYEFRQTLSEKAIDLDLLRTLSASRAVDDLARNVQQMLYLTANGREPANHERSEIRLEEDIARELNLYAWAHLPVFLPMVREIDRFWRRWSTEGTHSVPDMGNDQAPLDESLPTRHDIERGMLIAIQSYTNPASNQSPPDDVQANEAGGYSRAYFHHLLDGQARESGKLPMRNSFSRGLGLELRAMRRWVDQGRNPTAAEQTAARCAFDAIAHLSAGEHVISTEGDLSEAFNINRYFQLWPADDKTKQWPAVPSGIIADAEQFKMVLDEVWSDSACLLVLSPEDPVLLNLARQIRRVAQSAEYGRELSETERAEVSRALTSAPRPANGTFANVPDFSDSLIDRIRQIHDYYFGVRASSRKAFAELLRVARDELRTILRGRTWDEDAAPLAAIDRQLRAVQRWSAANRQPTPEERSATREVLATVAELRGLSQMPEWAKRVLELSKTFSEGLPPDGGLQADQSNGFASIEDFALALEDAQNDCRSFCGRRLMRKPVGPEIAWDDLEQKLAVVRRMVDQGRVPTRRERTDIHAALTDIQALGANPAASIHDFLEDFAAKLARIDAHYTWLVTAGPYGGKETGAVDEAGVHCVELGGEMRIAFFRDTGSEPGIYVCRAEKTSARQQTGAIEFDMMRYLPSTRDLLRLVPCEGWTPTRLAWNAHSDWLAYQIPGRAPQVGWCATREAGEKGRIAADAFAWATQGSSLIGIDLAAASVFRLNAENGQRKELIALPGDLDRSITPHIAIAPGGQSLALAVGRAGGKIELALIEFEGNHPTFRSRGLFVGAKCLLISWLNGAEIGCLLVTPGGSELLSVPSSQGEATTLHASKIPLPTSAPACASGGKYVAFFQPAGGNLAALSLLDCDTREIVPLLNPGAAAGRLSFGEETIAIQGGDAAVVIWPHISFRRKPIERF